MADNRTMAQLLEAPTVGYEDAIVVPEITDGHFNLSTVSYPRSKTKQFFGDMTKMTLYAHIPFYNKIASTDESRTIPSTSIKLRLFLFSIDGAGPDLVEKNPLDRFLSWDVLECISKFVNSNTASTSGSGTLPSNTITNPKVDLKGITTRSGVAYQGPTIPTTTSSPPKVVERETEVTKDTVPPTNNGSTKDVQPPVVQIQTHIPNSEPVVTPISAPMPNLKPTIPYPSRRNDERRREKANDQIEKF
ncbi:hypothetical protein Tco_1575500 [Tanacetum coccineum]